MYGRYGRYTPAARFWSKVARDAECWEWRGGRMKKGYGVFAIADGVFIGAHRAAWILTHGPLPPGAFVCHACDNPQCVRPSHLFVGSALLNVRDMDAKGRRRTPRGEESASAKLCWSDVEAIRATAVRGLNRWRRGNWPLLAAQYGVDRSVISRIMSGDTWRP